MESKLLELFISLVKTVQDDSAVALIDRRELMSQIRAKLCTVEALTQCVAQPTWTDGDGANVASSIPKRPDSVLSCLKLGLQDTQPPELRTATVDQLNSMLHVRGCTFSIAALLRDSGLLFILLKDPLLGADIKLAEKAANLLIAMSRLPAAVEDVSISADRRASGLDVLLSDAIAGKLFNCTEKSTSALQIRVAELFFRCACDGDDEEERAARILNTPESPATRIVHRMLPLMFGDSDDVLINLNALELVKTLAHSTVGRRFLQERGVFEHLLTRLRTEATRIDEPDALERIYVNALVKCAGDVGVASPAPADYVTVVRALLTRDDSASEHVESCLLSLATLGSASVSALTAIIDDEHLVRVSVAHALQSNDAVISAAAHHCCRQLIDTRAPVYTQTDSDSSSLIDRVYERFVARLGASDRTLAAQMFSDLDAHPAMPDTTLDGDFAPSVDTNVLEQRRLAPYAVVASLCSSARGAELVLRTDGLLELLLDRSHDASSRGLVLKHAIILSLVDNFFPNVSATVKRLLPPAMFDRLVEFAREGPRSTKAQSRVLVAEQAS